MDDPRHSVGPAPPSDAVDATMTRPSSAPVTRDRGPSTGRESRRRRLAETSMPVPNTQPPFTLTAGGTNPWSQIFGDDWPTSAQLQTLARSLE